MKLHGVGSAIRIARTDRLDDARMVLRALRNDAWLFGRPPPNIKAKIVKTIARDRSHLEPVVIDQIGAERSPLDEDEIVIDDRGEGLDGLVGPGDFCRPGVRPSDRRGTKDRCRRPGGLDPEFSGIPLGAW